MRAKFIINPHSGKQDALKNLESIVGCLILNQVVSQVDVYYTEQEGDAMREAARLQEGDFDFLVCVGGDGTLSDVVNGLMQSRCRIPVAVVAAGIANDFATYWNMPQTSEDFCRMIMNFKRRKIDVGKLNDRYFVNSVIGGTLAGKSEALSQESKAVFGKMAYYVNGVRNLTKPSQPVRLSFRAREFRKEEEAVMFIAYNGASAFAGRPIAAKPQPDDGFLDLLVIRKMDLAQITGMGLSTLTRGGIGHPRMKRFRTRQVEISILEGEDLPIECDGQYAGSLPIKLGVEPGALEIIVP